MVAGDEARVIVHETWNPGTDAAQVRDVTVWLERADGRWQIVEIGCPRPIGETPSGTVEAFHNWFFMLMWEKVEEKQSS